MTLPQALVIALSFAGAFALTVLAMACIAYPFVRAVWRRK